MPLPYDPDEAVRALAEADPRLGRLIRHVGPPGLEVRELLNPFQALMRAIVYQQLSGKAAATIYGRVQALFPGDGAATVHHVLEADEALLRGAGLSRAKTAAVKDLAARTLDGTVPSLAALREMADDEIVAHLTQVRGIGRWTAEMLLIFRLGRPDVLPATDLGVRRGVMRVDDLAEMPTPGTVLARGEPWRPYRSVASWYLWRAADLDALPG